MCGPRSAYGEHELAKAELKNLVPEDAKEAAGHGIRAGQALQVRRDQLWICKQASGR